MAMRSRFHHANVHADSTRHRRSTAARNGWWLWVGVLLLVVAAVCRASDTPTAAPTVELTPAEREWIDQHRVIHVAIKPGDQLPAQSWVAGRAEGIGVDYVRLLASRLGMQLEFTPLVGGWDESETAGGTDDHYDVYVGVRETDDGAPNFLYLPPYAGGKFMLVSRKGDEQIGTQADLDHARIVIARGFPWLALTLASRHPGATLLFANDERTAMDMVVSGEADAFIGVTEARTKLLMGQRKTDDVSMLSALDLPPVRIALAIPRDRVTLFDLLGKADASMDAEERDRLRSRWEGRSIAANSMPGAVDLSVQEKAWLSKLKPLRLGYEEDRYPYSFTNKEGRFDGMAAEYANILQEKLGIRVELVPARDWDALERMVKAREVDMVAASTPDGFRSHDMVFTQPYERFHDVIVAQSTSAVLRAEDLAGRKVAVRSEAVLVSGLKRLLPYSRIIPVASNEAGLLAVASGEADGFVGTLPAVDSLLRDRYAGELRVVGSAGIDQDVAFGISNQYAALAPLIDRVLAEIPDSERRGIGTRWINAEYHNGVPLSRVVSGMVASLCLLSIIGVAYVRLRRVLRAKERAEQGLTKQMALQVAMLESIPYPVFVKDEHCRYVAVNRAYEAMFECRREDLMGRNALEAGHMKAMDVQAIHAADLEVLKTGRGVRREAQVMLDNGHRPKDVLLWVHRLEGVDSEVVGALGTFVEVTDLRESEARARALENRLNEICTTLPGAFFQFRSSSADERQFTYVAGDTASLMGLTPQEIMADESALLARLHPDDQARTVQKVQASASDARPVEAFDFRINVNDTWRWVRTEGGQPHRLADGSMQWTGYWIDTTDFHEQQNELTEAKQRAEDAVAAKSAFLAMMSHEIRTPMVGVLGLIELLEKRAVNAEQAHMLRVAYDSAKSLLHILDDILDFSRIESGRLELESAPVSLREMADGVVGLFMGRANDKGVRLHLKVDWRLAYCHIGDATRLRQVMTNLLSNAIKFTSSGVVDVRIELIGRSDDVERVRISVVDTGIGISESQMAQLFRPFSQAEASTARRFGGTGLGLAISQGLAQAMGGHVSLHSSPGAGTTACFEFALPTTQERVVSPLLTGKSALLCVSSTLDSRDVSNHLSSTGLRVVEAESNELRDFIDDGIDLYVVDADIVDKGLLPINAACVRVVDSCDQRGFTQQDGRVTLYGSPVLWWSVLSACEAAVAGVGGGCEASTNHTEMESGARVLVAEDNAVNRLVISEQLRQLGYKHTLVDGGKAAWEAIHASNYDLLITDSHMPDVDGHELIRLVRNSEPSWHRRMPIVVLSASTTVDHVDRYTAVGADEVVAKPITLDTLRSLTSKYLDGP